MAGKRVYLSLGSNLGDREANLRRALDSLEAEHVHIVKASSVYETEPQEVTDQPWFLNLVAECETHCLPLQLLSILLGIERAAGRIRDVGAPGGPRVLDIDILLYNGIAMNLPQLTIPHPRMKQRRFVLEPLVEIAPDRRDPESGEPFQSALAKLTGQIVRKVER